MPRPEGLSERPDTAQIHRQHWKPSGEIPGQIRDPLLLVPKRLGRSAERAATFQRPARIAVAHDRLIR